MSPKISLETSVSLSALKGNDGEYDSSAFACVCGASGCVVPEAGPWRIGSNVRTHRRARRRSCRISASRS